MKKQEEKEHLSKLWKKMQQQFTLFTQTEAPEALHQFRVQVKKIRSFLTLLEEDKNNHGLLKTFKPVKKIFRSAGIIRDAFLHQQQGKEHHITEPLFYEEQAAIQKEETRKLLSKSEKHLQKMKRVKKSLKQHLHPLSATHILAFYKKGLGDNQQLLAQHSFNEELHDGRKMLKHLMYNQHAVTDDIAKDLNLDFDYIDELQNLLGQWHDAILALSFFEKTLGENDLHGIKEKKAELEKKITRKANNFEKKIKAVHHSVITA